MNTSLDCRARAAHDTQSALDSPLASRRHSFTQSAAAWTIRAEMLDRMGRIDVARYPSHRDGAI